MESYLNGTIQLSLKHSAFVRGMFNLCLLCIRYFTDIILEKLSFKYTKQTFSLFQIMSNHPNIITGT